MSLKVTELKNGFFVSTIKPTGRGGLGNLYETMVLNHQNFCEVSRWTNYHNNKASALQYHRRIAKKLQNKILVQGANDDFFTI